MYPGTQLLTVLSEETILKKDTQKSLRNSSKKLQKKMDFLLLGLSELC